ncbi:MAG: FADH(2)-oxidizing methylenetetrahydrofolate--tRNA-(uracil(54)-C(5))-methyltransferase TrmFO, partial [Pseudomonadota bacterium]|nr:FADH(2)-oxidizing methylenetetrahydrofolate--tRNA-(uracil(54)-C(5))-methyltransferase TrmFO [Pseudomonadota bacterium]
LFPPVEAPRAEGGKRLRGSEKAQAKKRALTTRALQDVEAWLVERREAAE